MTLDGTAPGGPQPHNQYEASHALAFIQQWDGLQPELTDGEIEQASRHFDLVIEATLIQYADWTVGNLFTYLGLQKTYDDGSRITVSIASSDMEHRLHMTEEDSTGELRNSYTYHSEPNDVVRRRDEVAYTNPDGSYLEGAAWRYDETGRKIPQNGAAHNHDLAEAMGYNNQPVSYSEIQQLGELLQQLKPIQSFGSSATYKYEL